MDKQDGADWNIAIDRIVIEGVPLTGVQQSQLKEALEAELSRMFAGAGVPRELRYIHGNVTGAPIRLQGTTAAPVQLGKDIAASVYKSLSGE